MDHIAVGEVQLVGERRGPCLAEIVTEIQGIRRVSELRVGRVAGGGRKLYAVGCLEDLQVVVVGFAARLHVKLEIDERSGIHLEGFVRTDVGGRLHVIARRRCIMLSNKKRVVKRADTGSPHHPLVQAAAVVQNPRRNAFWNSGKSFFITMCI